MRLRDHLLRIVGLGTMADDLDERVAEAAKGSTAIHVRVARIERRMDEVEAAVGIREDASRGRTT